MEIPRFIRLADGRTSRSKMIRLASSACTNTLPLSRRPRCTERLINLDPKVGKCQMASLSHSVLAVSYLLIILASSCVMEPVHHLRIYSPIKKSFC